MWAISKTLGSRNGHPQMWKGPMAYHRFAQKWDMANLGVSLAGKWMIYLTPERRLCFLFDQASALQDSELSEEVLLEEVLCKSLFPHRQYGQPASTQPLEPLPERMTDRMPVYLSLSICLSVWFCLSVCLPVCLILSVCLSVCLILSVCLSVCLAS